LFFMGNGDTRKRLSDWFGQWQPPLRKYLGLRRMVPPADIEDVAQEVFLRMMRYDRADLVEHPQAYLFKVASNVAAELAIRSRNRQPHESKWLSDLAAGTGPADDIARDSAQDEIERAIATLSPRQRAVIKLRFTEGLTQPQIAARLGTTPRAVKRDLMKSYAKLRV